MIKQPLYKFYSYLRSLSCVQQSYSKMATELNASAIKVAVCQMTSTHKKLENLQNVKYLISLAKKGGAAMAFLPEACDFIGTDPDHSAGLAETLGGTLMLEYRDLAIRNNIWLSIGGFHERAKGNKVYNTHVIIDSKGDVRATYRKIHMFDCCVGNQTLVESLTVKPGDNITQPIHTPIGEVGLMVCYDLRFPELSTLLTKLGANILTYPSAFTEATGRAHWEQLLRARAIENQCYVIAAAQVGRHNKNRCSYGRAMVINPWGKIIAECNEYEEGKVNRGEVAIANIDLNVVEGTRSMIPVFSHRRNDVYSLQVIDPDIITRSKNKCELFSDKLIPCSTVFLYSAYCFAFTNIRCVVPGHVLVASKRVVPRLCDLTQEEIADLFQTVVKVQAVVEREHNATSSTIVVQDGKEAGQTIRHVHVHVLPRKEGDFARNDDIYDALAKHDHTEETPIRALEEMTAEANLLRALLG